MITELNDTFWRFTLKKFPSLAAVINLAFSHGGFVAGGYPRIVYNALINNQDEIRLSDVDLFFRSKEGYERFIQALEKSVKFRSFTITPSKTDFATNVEFRGIDKLSDDRTFYNVQAIHAYFGTPEEVIMSFDFANCMIGFEKDKLFMGPRFKDVESNKILEVVNWRQGSLLYRIQKYVTVHGYKKLDAKSREKFVPWLYDAYCKIDVENRLLDHKRPLEVTEGRKQIRCHVRSLMNKEDIISDADLLLLCVMFEGETKFSYKDAFEELRRRSVREKTENWLDEQANLENFTFLPHV